MREDMFKVIVERPRMNRGYSRDGRRYRNDPEAPSHLGMKRGYRIQKWLNENLGPLRKYLVRQHGRPWNDVYSELSANIDRRNTVQAHIYAHLDGMVAVHTRTTLEGIQALDPGWRSGWKPLAESSQCMYVDPVTGVLCRNDARIEKRRREREQAREEERKRAAGFRRIDANRVLERLDGLWFIVTYAPLPRTIVRKARGAGSVDQYEACWDVKRRKWVSRSEMLNPQSHVDRHYAKSKQQVNRRALKRLLAGNRC